LRKKLFRNYAARKWRCFIASFTRVNFKIRVPRVRVIDENGEMLGVMQTREAQRGAQSRGLDLVEVSPNADPPVCKVMDYGKFRYEEGMKRKAARKNQKTTQVKEIKFHASVDTNDLDTKMRKIRTFLKAGHKVKLTLQYRGRENAHKELGLEVIKGIIVTLGEDVTVEQAPRIMGRVLGCLLAPSKALSPPLKGYTPPKSANRDIPK